MSSICSSIPVCLRSVMTCAVMAKAQNARNISRLMSLTFTHDRLIIARIICWLPQVLEQVSMELFLGVKTLVPS